MKIILSVAIKEHLKIILQEFSFCFEIFAVPYGVPKSSLNKMTEAIRYELKNQIDNHAEISHSGTKSVLITRAGQYLYLSKVFITPNTNPNHTK